MKKKRAGSDKRSEPKAGNSRSRKAKQKHEVNSDLAPEVQRQLRVAEGIMEEYRETLEFLAKT